MFLVFNSQEKRFAPFLQSFPLDKQKQPPYTSIYRKQCPIQGRSASASMKKNGGTLA